MSYDLVVEGERWREVHRTFAASVNAAECELRASESAFVVGLPRADDAVRRAYGELVTLARARRTSA